MKVVALISGGKDSCYNMMQCVAEGHDIVALANLKPKDKDELDSYMYQSVGHHVIDLYAEAMDLPLYRREIMGSSVSTGRDYQTTLTDEVEDLYELLKQVKTEVKIEGVAVGAILSNYQRVRVENVCLRLGLMPLAYLWRRDQIELLDEMICCGVKAIIIKVAAMGLQPKQHLGQTLEEMQPYLLKKNSEFDLNVCGEGGEFETFTLDCPLFKKTIVIDESKMVIHSDDAFAPVGYLNLMKAHLENKTVDSSKSYKEIIKDLPMKTSSTTLSELFPDPKGIICINCGKTDYPSSTDKIQDNTSPAKYHCGNHLWISNVMAVNDGKTEIEMLTRTTLDVLKSLVTSCGPEWDLSCLVLVHLFVKNMADFARINSVYKTYFGLNPAARVCVQTDLPENVDLLLDCYGYSCHGDRETMHVQGCSHWAPANIGPYSQCVQIRNDLYVAGQIGMVPANLSVIEGGIHPQARLSLQHVNSVLGAMVTGCSLKYIKSCVCYVTQKEFIPVAKQELLYAMNGESPLCNAVYVVVPTLPKNALIEWQVVAVKNVPRELKRDRLIKPCGGTELVINFLHEEEMDEEATSKLLLLSGSLYKERGIELEINLSEIAKVIQASIQQITSITGENPKSILRIFYSSSVFSYEKLFAALHGVIADTCAITVIPILEFEDDTMLLTMCLT